MSDHLSVASESTHSAEMKEPEVKKAPPKIETIVEQAPPKIAPKISKTIPQAVSTQRRKASEEEKAEIKEAMKDRSVDRHS